MKSKLLSQLPNIRHDFGTRQEPKCLALDAYFKTRPTKTQVHATHIAIATHSGQQAGDADGWFTEEKGILLSVVNADCYPLLLSRKDGSAVAALHVGWRGAFHGMVSAFGDLLKERGDSGSQWVAAIGPGAGACCYEVSESLIDDFALRVSLPVEVISPSYRKLDLPAIIDAQLQAIGIQERDFSELCTICAQDSDKKEPLFYSYRRDHTRDVQFSVIMRNE